jgi:hypothetical protein
MNQDQQDAIQAAAFRGLIAHLQERTDAQNIDLMNLAGFCRNCLSKWVLAASNEQNAGLDYDDALEMVYGMPYAQWKEKYQEKASAKQLETFEKTKPIHANISGHL